MKRYILLAIICTFVVILHANANMSNTPATQVTFSPSIFSIISTNSNERNFINKEELENIKLDAINFLADNENASEALIKTIKNIKERIPDTNDLTDKQIAAIVLASLK